jgi:signal transduction histidine kinase
MTNTGTRDRIVDMVGKLKRGKNFYLVFSVMGLFISLAVCAMVYFQFRSFIDNSYFGTLANVAVMVERQYPVIYDIEAMKEGILDNEDWLWEIHRQWLEIKNVFHIAYIYYMERSPDGYVRILSTTYTRDMKTDWLGALIWKYEPTPAGVDEAWDTQKITFSPRPSVEEEWGILVSAYLPVVKNGGTIGILGVDYDISYVNSLENRVLVFLIISFAASAALTGVLAFIGSRSVVVTIEERERTAREAVERHMEIENLMNALKNASETRTAFLSEISSAMADPINNIIRLSSLLSKYKEISEDHQKHLEVINDEGMKLFDVISDILDILKIEAGKIKFNPAKYQLPKFIRDVTSPYSIHTEDKLIQYKLVVDEKLPLNLVGDELRIRQICHHLLTNAFKYTDEGSITVNITCKHKNDYVILVIKVIDTGIGMTENKLNNIFINYGQGTGGIGLFLCKKLAELMKGTLSATSEHGYGSVFKLCVPQKLLSSETIGQATARRLVAFKD